MADFSRLKIEALRAERKDMKQRHAKELARIRAQLERHNTDVALQLAGLAAMHRAAEEAIERETTPRLRELAREANALQREVESAEQRLLTLRAARGSAKMRC